jgi:hypothetical protein
VARLPKCTKCQSLANHRRQNIDTWVK